MTRHLCIAAVAALLLACPGGRGGDAVKNSPPKTTTSPAINPQSAPENATAMNPVTEPNRETPSKRGEAATVPVKIELLEYEIRMPDTIAAGRQTLSITNSGKEPHSLAITGTGFSQQLSTQIPRGDSATLDVNLRPGMYTFSCPVDGDAGKGMRRTVSAK